MSCDQCRKDAKAKIEQLKKEQVESKMDKVKKSIQPDAKKKHWGVQEKND